MTFFLSLTSHKSHGLQYLHGWQHNDVISSITIIVMSALLLLKDEEMNQQSHTGTTHTATLGRALGMLLYISCYKWWTFPYKQISIVTLHYIIMDIQQIEWNVLNTQSDCKATNRQCSLSKPHQQKLPGKRSQSTTHTVLWAGGAKTTPQWALNIKDGHKKLNCSGKFTGKDGYKNSTDSRCRTSKEKCWKEGDSQIRTYTDQEHVGRIFWSTCLRFSLMLKNMRAPQHPDVQRNTVSAAS